MTLLDKFRAQPRDKHPDPSVRLAYVEEIPLTERDAIAAAASGDEDPRVRRAAVAKLMDAALLGRIASADADEGVRTEASAMLRDIALDRFEGMREADSLDAVDAIADGKLLAQIAKTAEREVVALHAIARLSVLPGPDGARAADLHALGSIARHGATEAARRSAFELLREHGDQGDIVAVAMNGEHKDTSLSAVDLVSDRAVLEQIAAGAKSKAASRRARGVIREAEARAKRVAAEAEEAARAVRAEADGQELAAVAGPDVTATGGAHEATPASAVDPVAVDPASSASAEEEERALVEAAERARAEKAAAAARAAAEEAARQNARREAQEAEARARREAMARVQHILSRVEPLAAGVDVTLKAADRALRDVRALLTDMPPLPGKQELDAVSHRLKAVQASLTDKVHELREASEWRQWANAGIQEELCAKMEALRAGEDLEAIAAEVRNLQQQWRLAADVPRARADALWRRFKAAHDEVWAKCEGHFAAQAAERAANLARKTALCEKVEELADSTSWVQTAEAIKALQAEWKTIGAVPRGREKAIWERFRAACDKFFTRRHEDLAKRKQVWAENLARKEALVLRVETLAESTDWDATAAELKRLQNEWRAIGPVKKSRSEAIWQRFRGACDRFFVRFAQRHELHRAERARAREELCAELESLAAPIGEGDPAPAETEVLTKVRGIRSRWLQEVGQRGVERDQARVLDERFAAAFANVVARWPGAFAGTDLDPDANRKRMESLVKRVEDLAESLDRASPAAGDGLSPTTRLAAMLKEALAANTIGGKVDVDNRLRAAAEEVRQAQSSWSRIGAVPEAARRPLAGRFDRACRRITDRASGASKGIRS